MHTSDFLDEDIPLLFVGFGPKSIAFAAQHFDGIVSYFYV